MNLRVVQRIFGLLLMLFSVSMLPPALVAFYYGDGNWSPFLDAFLLVLALGTLVWWPARRHERDLRLRDGFLIVSLFWVVLGLAGSVPLLLSEQPAMSVTDAVFEAVSGFTTTGATVLTGLDTMPPSVLYYRHQIQWLGGIGIVVLAVALLPMLGIGGMQLLRAETPGPVKDAKLTPRITETAKALWVVYVAITTLCATAYWLAGMSAFDAIGHSFSTVSTGGYSSHDASLGYFESAAIETLAAFFMFLGGVNFSLHFLAWRHLRLRDYWHDAEFRGYALIVLMSITVTTVVLMLSGTYPTAGEAFRKGLLQATSVQTSTGFTTADFSVWPGALPVVLIFLSFVSGSAGSTSGGMKVIRWLLIVRQGVRELVRLLHPSAEVPVKIGGKPVAWRVVDAVWGFFAVYISCFALLLVLLMSTGQDQITAFSAIATCMNNLGPGLGAVTSNFASISDAGKLICVVAMLLGRLEIFPLLLILTPGFWRR